MYVKITQFFSEKEEYKLRVAFGVVSKLNDFLEPLDLRGKLDLDIEH
jgi:hypothetical protein